eukprot:753934-Hanusia_phi.AAC.2
MTLQAFDVLLSHIRTTQSRCAAKYFAGKGYSALNVQFVCDSKCKILWCDIQNPGSIHESIAFTRGQLATKLASPRLSLDSYLVADAAHKSIRNVLTPFGRRNLPKLHARFDFYLSQIRINNRLRTDNMAIKVLVIGVYIYLQNSIHATDGPFRSKPLEENGLKGGIHTDTNEKERLELHQCPVVMEMIDDGSDSQYIPEEHPVVSRDLQTSSRDGNFISRKQMLKKGMMDKLKKHNLFRPSCRPKNGNQLSLTDCL